MNIKSLVLASVCAFSMAQAADYSWVIATQDTKDALLMQMQEAIRVKRAKMIAQIYMQSFNASEGSIKAEAFAKIKTINDHGTIVELITEFEKSKNFYALNDLKYNVYRATKYEAMIDDAINKEIVADKARTQQEQAAVYDDSAEYKQGVYPSLANTEQLQQSATQLGSDATTLDAPRTLIGLGAATAVVGLLWKLARR